MDLFEVRRKIFHMIGGALILIGVLSGYVTQWILVGCIVIILLSSFIIKMYPNKLFSFILMLFERQKNIEKFPLRGMFFFFLGCTVPLFVFSFPVAVLSIVILTIGDAASALVGKYFGRTKHPLHTSKMIEGHIAGGLLAFGAATAMNYAFVYGLPWWNLLITSMATMFIEGIEHIGSHEWVDDNLTIPLIAGVIMEGLRLI